MPVALVSWKKDSDGRVRVGHIFLAPNIQEAEELKAKHAGGCKAYGPAVEAGETIDLDYDVDYLPEAEEEDLAEFLESFGAAYDEEEGSEEEEEQEEEGAAS